MNTISIEKHPSWKPEPARDPAPDTCLTKRDENQAIIARCALWWNQSPPDPDGLSSRVGAVGQFECLDEGSGIAILERAQSILREAGCARAVGPLDGDTWHTYRFVTGGRESASRFFLEPWNDPVAVDAFRSAGFVPLASYSSSAFPLGNVEEATSARLERIEHRARDRGVTVRTLRVGKFEEELGRLFELSEVAFRDNFLYTPIPRESFLALYLPLKPLVDPASVLLAEKDGQAVGFVFGIPDTAALEEKRFIVKTLAVHPRFRHLGIGSLLVHRVQEAARKAGFREAIHALQYEDNSSLKITDRNEGRPIREYSLFHRILANSP